MFFAFYIVYLRGQSSSAISIGNLPVIDTKQSGSQVLVTPTVTPTQTKTPAPVGHGFKNGTYTGSVEDAFYGNVQVRVTIQGGDIADVQFLDYPHDRNTSREINSQAMPYLKTEAIQAQSANVNVISGATATSEAFIQSLASALAQAK